MFICSACQQPGCRSDACRIERKRQWRAAMKAKTRAKKQPSEWEQAKAQEARQQKEANP